MRLETQQKLRDQAITRIHDALNNAAHFGPSQDVMLTERQEIYNAILPCPRYMREYVRGYYDALYKRLMQKMIHCYVMPSGLLVSSHATREDYYKKCGITAEDVYKNHTASGLYWDIRGALIPFYVNLRKTGH